MAGIANYAIKMEENNEALASSIALRRCVSGWNTLFGWRCHESGHLQGGCAPNLPFLGHLGRCVCFAQRLLLFWFALLSFLHSRLLPSSTWNASLSVSRRGKETGVAQHCRVASGEHLLWWADVALAYWSRDARSSIGHSSGVGKEVWFWSADIFFRKSLII